MLTDHTKLMMKLEAYGVNKAVVAWINKFLSNRKQQVGVRGEVSS